MSLKNLPLDAGKLGPALCISVGPKIDPMTNLAKANTEGIPLYVVAVAVAPEGQRPALVEITVTGEPRDLIVGTHVALRGLEAFWWEMSGKSGLIFRADAIVPTLAPLAPETPPALAAGVKGAAK